MMVVVVVVCMGVWDTRVCGVEICQVAYMRSNGTP